MTVTEQNAKKSAIGDRP